MHEIRKRGRPRPPETVRRDADIAVLLVIDAWPLQALADELSITPGQAYHALRRLQRAGRVFVIRNGKRHLWTATTHA